MKKINKLGFLLFLLILAIFPLGVVIRITPITNVNIYPLDLGVGLIALVTFFSYFKTQYTDKKIFKPIIIFNIVAVVSLSINSLWLNGIEFLIALSYLIRFNAYLSLLFIGVLGFSKKQREILKKLFLYSSMLLVLFGFLQYLFYNNLRNLYYLGWDEHLYRMFSTFLDPNFMGLFLALLILFLAGKIIKNKKLFLDPYVLYLSFTFLALILTYSRTAIIALFAGLTFMTLHMKKIKLLLVSFALMFWAVFVLSNFSIEGMNPLRIASSEARIETAREAFEVFTNSPLYGVGFNAYRYALVDRGERNADLTRNSNADAGTDNSFLFILATTGIVGLIAYFSIWKEIAFKINGLNRVDKSVAFSIIIALFSGSLFINALFYIPIMMWMFTYLGLYALSDKD